MQNFINALTERNYKNRKIGLIENGSWAPAAAKIMRAAFEKSENIEFCPTTVKIVGAVSEENEEQIRSDLSRKRLSDKVKGSTKEKC